MINHFSRQLIFIGFLLIFIGILLFLNSSMSLSGRLPGDIYIKKGSFTLYAPLSTSLLISIIISVIFYIISRLP